MSSSPSSAASNSSTSSFNLASPRRARSQSETATSGASPKWRRTSPLMQAMQQQQAQQKRVVQIVQEEEEGKFDEDHSQVYRDDEDEDGGIISFVDMPHQSQSPQQYAQSPQVTFSSQLIQHQISPTSSHMSFTLDGLDEEPNSANIIRMQPNSTSPSFASARISPAQFNGINMNQKRPKQRVTIQENATSTSFNHISIFTHPPHSGRSCDTPNSAASSASSLFRSITAAAARRDTTPRLGPIENYSYSYEFDAGAAGAAGTNGAVTPLSMTTTSIRKSHPSSSHRVFNWTKKQRSKAGVLKSAKHQPRSSHPVHIAHQLQLAHRRLAQYESNLTLAGTMGEAVCTENVKMEEEIHHLKTKIEERDSKIAQLERQVHTYADLNTQLLSNDPPNLASISKTQKIGAFVSPMKPTPTSTAATPGSSSSSISSPNDPLLSIPAHSQHRLSSIGMNGSDETPLEEFLQTLERFFHVELGKPSMTMCFKPGQKMDLAALPPWQRDSPRNADGSTQSLFHQTTSADLSSLIDDLNTFQRKLKKDRRTRLLEKDHSRQHVAGMEKELEEEKGKGEEWKRKWEDVEKMLKEEQSSNNLIITDLRSQLTDLRNKLTESTSAYTRLTKSTEDERHQYEMKLVSHHDVNEDELEELKAQLKAQQHTNATMTSLLEAMHKEFAGQDSPSAVDATLREENTQLHQEVSDLHDQLLGVRAMYETKIKELIKQAGFQNVDELEQQIRNLSSSPKYHHPLHKPLPSSPAKLGDISIRSDMESHEDDEDASPTTTTDPLSQSHSLHPAASHATTCTGTDESTPPSPYASPAAASSITSSDAVTPAPTNEAGESSEPTVIEVKLEPTDSSSPSAAPTNTVEDNSKKTRWKLLSRIGQILRVTKGKSSKETKESKDKEKEVSNDASKMKVEEEDEKKVDSGSNNLASPIAPTTTLKQMPLPRVSKYRLSSSFASSNPATSRFTLPLPPFSLSPGDELALSYLYRYLLATWLQSFSWLDSHTTATPSLWIEDRISGHCFSCQRHWTTLARRHHCRLCGALFCGTCSRFRVDLDKFEMTQVRCCLRCFGAVQSMTMSNSLSLWEEQNGTLQPPPEKQWIKSSMIDPPVISTPSHAATAGVEEAKVDAARPGVELSPIGETSAAPAVSESTLAPLTSADASFLTESSLPTTPQLQFDSSDPATLDPTPLPPQPVTSIDHPDSIADDHNLGVDSEPSDEDEEEEEEYQDEAHAEYAAAFSSPPLATRTRPLPRRTHTGNTLFRTITLADE